MTGQPSPEKVEKGSLPIILPVNDQPVKGAQDPESAAQ